MRLPRPISAVLASALLLATGIGATQCPEPVERGRFTLPGLSSRVRVSTDALGVPHVYAENDLDLYRVQGYLRARDRFFQIRVGNHIQDGCKGLLGDNRHLGSGFTDAWFDIGTGVEYPATQRFAAVQDHAALLLDLLEGRLHLSNGVRVDEGSHQHAFFEGITNGHLLVGIDQCCLFEWGHPWTA